MVVVTVVTAAVTMATVGVIMGMAAATGISAGTTVIFVVTMAAASSRSPVHIREAIFAAIAPLPGAAARTSARSATPRCDRVISATR